MSASDAVDGSSTGTSRHSRRSNISAAIGG